MSDDVRGERKGRTLEIEIEVDASPSEVWQALSTGEGLANWFAPFARVTSGAGGSVWISWGGDMEGEGRLHAWEVERHLGWTELHGDKRLAVDFEIEGRGGTTRVRLVHSGFEAGADWDAWFDGTRRGWSYFLGHLKHYLERHRGTARQMISARRPAPGTRAQTWGALFGASGFDVPGAREGRSEGEAELRLGRERLPLRILAAEAPFTFAAIVPSLADALLFVELEGEAPEGHCGLWLSTYGLPAERVATLQAALDRMADAALGAVPPPTAG